MRIQQLSYRPEGGWSVVQGERSQADDAQLVLVFGAPAALESEAYLQPLRDRYPRACVVSCSSGGEIAGDRVLDDSAVATAVRFDATRVVAVQEPLADAAASAQVGEALARRLPHDGLRHVLVFAEGLAVNGSALASGLASALPDGVSVTGGLAADGARFARTLVGLDAGPSPKTVVAVGLYGDRLTVGMGSLGGWEVFGPDHRITRSEGNVLHELDGEPALTVYKRYLGPRAYALPASGLLFPLSVRTDPNDTGVVRTLLGIDEAAGSITFAGDVPTGRHARLMRANLDRLIDASGTAAERTTRTIGSAQPELVLLISCIGRKLLLQLRVEEEVRSARKVFGPDPVFTGYYSYGEISPMTPAAKCELHNQTMTITTFSER